MALYDENIQKALEYLVKKQNADGGWGYRDGGMSYTEPTAFGLLALFSPLGVAKTNPTPQRASAVTKALAWLRTTVLPSGGWGTFQGDETGGWTTAPVLWSLNILLTKPELSSQFAKPEDTNLRNRSREWLVKNFAPVTNDAEYRLAKNYYSIDPDLLSWGWVPGDVGWIIPTALAMIGLTVEDRELTAGSEQMRSAKNYLRNRLCDGGGWNVGLPYIFDKPLPPVADATAYALLAYGITRNVSDFGQNKPFSDSADVLSNFLDKTNSDHTMALGLLGLRFYRDSSDRELPKFYNKLIKGTNTPEKPVPTSLGQNVNDGGWARSPFTTALAVLAMNQSLYFSGGK
jgi:Prenyltransferase and squalene oxidase repeat